MSKTKASMDYFGSNRKKNLTDIFKQKTISYDMRNASYKIH